VNSETPENAKVLLYQAVKCIPTSTELWLALAKLETYEKARDVINQARSAIPQDHLIWVAAAKLEEGQGNTNMVGMIINKAIKKLSKFENKLKREQWLQEAIQAEKGDSLHVCKAIVKETMYY